MIDEALSLVEVLEEQERELALPATVHVLGMIRDQCSLRAVLTAAQDAGSYPDVLMRRVWPAIIHAVAVMKDHAGLDRALTAFEAVDAPWLHVVFPSLVQAVATMRDRKGLERLAAATVPSIARLLVSSSDRAEFSRSLMAEENRAAIAKDLSAYYRYEYFPETDILLPLARAFEATKDKNRATWLVDAATTIASSRFEGLTLAEIADFLVTFRDPKSLDQVLLAARSLECCFRPVVLAKLARAFAASGREGEARGIAKEAVSALADPGAFEFVDPREIKRSFRMVARALATVADRAGLDDLTSAVRGFDQEVTSQALPSLAKALAVLGDTQTATLLLDEAIAAFEKDPAEQTFFVLARSLSMFGYDAGLERLRTTTAISDWWYEPIAVQAYMDLGRPREAEALVRAALGRAGRRSKSDTCRSVVGAVRFLALGPNAKYIGEISTALAAAENWRVKPSLSDGQRFADRNRTVPEPSA